MKGAPIGPESGLGDVMVRRRCRLILMTRHSIVAAFFCSLGSASGAGAQSYDAMGCDELWYARNAIYAAKGYCFKTAHAQQVFGPRCFPPYGALTPAEQSQVNLIPAGGSGKELLRRRLARAATSSLARRSCADEL